MTEGTTGILFFEEYFGFMDDLTPEQFYEFMQLIRDLRFNGVDKDPAEVEDKSVRLVWRSVRPSILKSAKNAKDHKKRNETIKEEPIVEEAPLPTISTPTEEKTEIQRPVFTDKEELKNYYRNELLGVYDREGYAAFKEMKDKFQEDSFSGLTCDETLKVVNDVIHTIRAIERAS